MGGLKALTDDGRNAWGGMDFAYRASQVGYITRRCSKAVAHHEDYALQDLETYCNRMRNVSRLVVLLFQRNNEIIDFVPMFRDKIPIAWRKDPPNLIVRKMARHLVSLPIVLRFFQKLVKFVEKYYPLPFLIQAIHRWIIGGYIYVGYREGLLEYGPVKTQNRLSKT